MSQVRTVMPIVAAVILTIAFQTTAQAAENKVVAGKIETYVRQHNLQCMSCHALDSKVLGPAWMDVAKRFHGKKGAAGMLAKRIANCNVGVWGSVPMPPGMATPAQAKVLAKWILELDTTGKK